MLQLPLIAMMSPPVSPLRRWVQRTIDAINLPFRVLEYVFTPIINSLRSSWRLACRICKQNWVFLCIFYLHLWQTFKSSAPMRPIAQHWTHITSGLLFVSCTAYAVLILCASLPLYLASYRDSKSASPPVRIHHLALFTLTCAPVCAVLGAVFAAVYYVFKRHQHGVYLANMRKLGNKYWADPRDFVDCRKVANRKEAIERLQAWDDVENKKSFIVDRICIGCGAVKQGLSGRCERCGDHGEKMVRRRNV